jgi:hypothetical protein
MSSFKVCAPHPIFSGNKIKKNEIGRACSLYGGGEEYAGF